MRTGGEVFWGVRFVMPSSFHQAWQRGMNRNEVKKKLQHWPATARKLQKRFISPRPHAHVLPTHRVAVVLTSPAGEEATEYPYLTAFAAAAGVPCGSALHVSAGSSPTDTVVRIIIVYWSCDKKRNLSKLQGPIPPATGCRIESWWHGGE